MSDERVVSAVIDRIEGDWAIIQVGGTEVQWPAGQLPAGSGEGTHLRIRIVTDDESEMSARSRIEELQRRLGKA